MLWRRRTRASSRNVVKISFLPSEVVKKREPLTISCLQEQLRNLCIHDFSRVLLTEPEPEQCKSLKKTSSFYKLYLSVILYLTIDFGIIQLILLLPSPAEQQLPTLKWVVMKGRRQPFRTDVCMGTMQITITRGVSPPLPSPYTPALWLANKRKWHSFQGYKFVHNNIITFTEIWLRVWMKFEIGKFWTTQ